MIAVSGETFAMNENEQHEIEMLKERVRDLERQLAQEQTMYLDEIAVLKETIQRVFMLRFAALKAQLQQETKEAEDYAREFA